jgi:enterochelin esterase-like enzyme
MLKCLVVTFSILPFFTIAQKPKITNGSIKHYEAVQSKFISERTVDVWMPEGYNKNDKYAVLYMNDGNEVFDSTENLKMQGWGVDKAISKLLTEGKIRKCIVVAVWNTNNRHGEYFPQKPFETFSKKQQDSFYTVKLSGEIMLRSKVQSDNYLNFLIKELKPFIDKNFYTLKDVDNTFIAGSSMGALISLYALCEYLSIFGGAACLSTHWLGLLPDKKNLIPTSFNNYILSHIPSSTNHKLYFDYGSIMVDYYYKPLQEKVDSIFMQNGYDSNNYLSKQFIGEDHSIKAWRKRVALPLLFLLKK